jgi:hypothetical protein
MERLLAGEAPAERALANKGYRTIYRVCLVCGDDAVCDVTVCVCGGGDAGDARRGGDVRVTTLTRDGGSYELAGGGGVAAST